MTPNCRTIAAKCQCCQKPLTLEVDADYAAMNDPHSLIRMAACNRCADIHRALTDTSERIGKMCHQIWVVRKMKNGEERVSKLMPALTAQARSYARAFTRKHNQPEAWVLFDQAFPDLLAEKPEQWDKILRHYHVQARRHFQDCARHAADQTTNHPSTV